MLVRPSCFGEVRVFSKMCVMLLIVSPLVVSPRIQGSFIFPIIWPNSI